MSIFRLLTPSQRLTFSFVFPVCCVSTFNDIIIIHFLVISLVILYSFKTATFDRDKIPITLQKKVKEQKMGSNIESNRAITRQIDPILSTSLAHFNVSNALLSFH